MTEVKRESKLSKLKKKEFNLVEVIVIMIITSICVSVVAIIVSFTVNRKTRSFKTDSQLVEFATMYQRINDEYYDKIDKDELIGSAIEGMVDYLDDPYTVYYSKTESQKINKELDGEYIGIGVEIKLNKTNDGINQYVINKVFDNSPAQKAGVCENDILVKINNQTIEKKSIDEVSKLVQGKKNTKLKLTLERKNNQINVEILRSKVDMPSVSYRKVNKNSKNIGVVSISVFAENTSNQFKKIVKNFEEEKLDGLILDLRSNTGGYLKAAEELLDMFLNKGDTLYQLNSKGKTNKIVNKESRSINLKTVVLVNAKTASAAEIVTASLKENLNCAIVGTKTYGKGKVQKTRILSNGSMIKYTTQNWLTPKGNKIDGEGITPTIEVRLTKDYINAPSDATDSQFQEAINQLIK